MKLPLKTMTLFCLYHAFFRYRPNRLPLLPLAVDPFTDMAAVNSEKDLHKVYDGLPCPRCPVEQGSKVITTIFGQGAFIRICYGCGWCVGVDDSVNLCDLGSERWDFEVVGSVSGNSCLKDKNHVPMFIGLDAESLMHSICINCLKTGIMFNVDGKTEDTSDKDAPVCDVDEILRMIFANAIEKNSFAELDSPIPDTVEEEIASIVDTKSDEMIAMVLRIDYAEQTEFACKCGRKECPKCRSDLFAGTSKSETSELTNRKVEPALKSVEKTPVKTHVRVTNLNQLQPGDHIAWDRCYAIWHHAIVMCVETDSQEIVVVHNSGGLKDKRNGKMASVRQETIQVNCTADFLYLYRYNDDECYPPEEVFDRAVECLNQSYNPFKYNCEHFARWCKAGLKCCLQMEKFCQRLKMGSSSLVKFIEEWTLVALRILGNSETMGQILATGAKGAREAIKDQLGTVAGSTKLFRYLGLGTMIGSIVLSIATEVIFFIYKLFNAKKAADNKEKPWDEFQRDIVELIFEGLFGLGGGLAVGYGFSLIPCVGLVLSPLGYLLGNWIWTIFRSMFRKTGLLDSVPL